MLSQALCSLCRGPWSPCSCCALCSLLQAVLLRTWSSSASASKASRRKSTCRLLALCSIDKGGVSQIRETCATHHSWCCLSGRHHLRRDGLTAWRSARGVATPPSATARVRHASVIARAGFAHARLVFSRARLLCRLLRDTAHSPITRCSCMCALAFPGRQKSHRKTSRTAGATTNASEQKNSTLRCGHD